MYRILTEDKNREKIYEILDKAFSGYTITEAIGSWKGVREKSLAIDLVNTDSIPEVAFEHLVGVVCRRIKTANEQQTVLYLVIPETFNFV